MINFIRNKALEKKIIDYNDTDVIVEFDNWPDLLTFVRYQLDLEEITGKKIDLIAGEEAISKYILPYINKEKRVVYENKL